MSGATAVATPSSETVPVATLRRTDCCSALMTLILEVTSLIQREGPLSEAQKAVYLVQKNRLICHLPDSQICPSCQKALNHAATHSDSHEKKQTFTLIR